MVKATQVMLSDSDSRYFRVEPGYRYGVYLERDKPAPHNTRANLCVYRVPEGMRAPYGRIPDELLMQMADRALQETEPEVIARFPYFSAWYPLEDAGDVEFEELRILPPSDKDGLGNYVQPLNPMTPLGAVSEKVVREKAHEKPPGAVQSKAVTDG